MRWTFLAASAALAQVAVPLTLEEAVRRTAENYPSIRVSAEQLSAAAAGVHLARTAYLPRVDALAQVNRATRNNIYGMLMPQQVIAPISGPPHPENSLTNVWGTAVGFLVSWEPFDFGLRQAQVDAAGVTRKRAEASLERTRFETSASAADAYLTILAAERTVEAARAAVGRATTLHKAASALVKAGLRPGAEEARARAEVALAETQLIQAEQSVAVAKAALAQLTGGAAADIRLDPGRLLGEPVMVDTAAGVASSHPSLREQEVEIDDSKARMRILDKSYYPRLNLQGTTYARGTGARPDFTTGGAASGLGPNIHNWGIGWTVSLPVMDYASLRARKQIESARERTESARYDLVKRELDGKREKAKALLDGARRIALTIPAQIEAARATEQQAGARYRAGLGTIVEVADAQRLLAQTEIDSALARLGVWRALLAVAAAQGDLEPFLASAR